MTRNEDVLEGCLLGVERMDVPVPQQGQEVGVRTETVERELPASGPTVEVVLHHDRSRAVGELQVMRRVDETDLPADDEGHAVAQLVGHRHVVRRQEHGAPGLLLLADEALDAPRVAGVEPHRRLVQEDQPRVVEQGARHAEPRLHPLGVLRDETLAVVGQSHHLEQRFRPAGFPAIQRAEIAQVLHAGQPEIVVRQLERNADLFVVVGAPGGEVPAQHGDRAAVARQQPGQHLLGGGLARAARSEKPEYLAGVDAERQVPDRRAVRRGVREFEFAYFDHRCCRRGRWPFRKRRPAGRRRAISRHLQRRVPWRGTRSGC